MIVRVRKKDKKKGLNQEDVDVIFIVDDEVEDTDWVPINISQCAPSNSGAFDRCVKGKRYHIEIHQVKFKLKQKRYIICTRASLQALTTLTCNRGITHYHTPCITLF